jgi:hypothetical protein
VQLLAVHNLIVSVRLIIINNYKKGETNG